MNATEQRQRRTAVDQLAADTETVIQAVVDTTTEKFQVLQGRLDREHERVVALQAALKTLGEQVVVQALDIAEAVRDGLNAEHATRLHETQVLRRTTLRGRLRWVFLGC